MIIKKIMNIFYQLNKIEIKLCFKNIYNSKEFIESNN